MGLHAQCSLGGLIEFILLKEEHHFPPCIHLPPSLLIALYIRHYKEGLRCSYSCFLLVGRD